MTAVGSTNGGTEVINTRRTETSDIAEITRLTNEATEEVFGRINVTYLLEKANLAVTVCNEKNEVVAHAALVDYPSWNDAIDQADWESWLYKNYDNSTKCTPLNSLFLQLLVAKEEFAVDCTVEIMRAVFNAVPDLHFIFLRAPADVKLAPALQGTFSPMATFPDSAEGDKFSLYVCHRYQHSPQLFIRKARVRDHDDLITIFMRQDDTLTETYGNYFLAELIEAQDEENHAVVGEDNGTAVGFMSVSTEVNLKLLQDCFDLGPFHGLCKPHPDDILSPIPTPEPSVTRVISRQESQRLQSALSQQSRPASSQDSDLKDIVVSEQASQKELQNASNGPTRSRSVSGVSEKGSWNRAASAEQQAADVIQGEDLQPPGTPARAAEKKKDVFRPVYKGELSAFCIQLFCIDEEHETRSLDFLNHVFNLFPDKDFCIITVPQLVPEFLLLQRFVRVVPLTTCTLPHELYVFHRSGLLSTLNVRLAKSTDFPAIEALVKALDLHESMLNSVTVYYEARRDPDGTPIQVFVAEIVDQIVGLSIIRNEEDIEYIRSHYNIEDFIYFNHHQREEHGHLYHFALNPIFKHYTKHFLKEILRLSHKSCLYYSIYPTDEEVQNPYAHSLTSALHYMVPVRPRRQIVYPLEKLGINAPSKRVSKDQISYALYHINRKLTLEPKVTINARIVVVGASDVGISFLETLVFCPHMRFNNITLVSTNGLSDTRLSGLKDGYGFLANSHCFNDKDYTLMSLRSWVNVVVGKMTAIDRTAKYVSLSKTEKVPYDHLVLCTGLQYQVPYPSGADISELVTNREIEDCSNKRYTGKVPSNLFTLHGRQDCQRALNWLQDYFVHNEGNAIVYGNSLDIYTTAETLLSLGITGSRIHLVQPPLASGITCFNNYAVEQAVAEALSEAGVTTYSSCILANWNDGDDPDPIKSASFTTDTKPFKLECAVFLSFSQKRVDYEAFKAMNDACLVYDGRLVINTTFHTNDVTIRAAGPLTKFSSRYYVNGWTHSNFNSKEVGFNLAATMLQLFDPTLEQVSEPPEDLDRLIPMYKGAKIQGGILPGGYCYLHIAKPTIPTPLDAQMAQPNYGQELVTGSAGDGTYFRLHINQYNMVETVTCLSKTPFPSSSHICLYGAHERLLNNLCSRFKEGLITDFYSYFSEPWSMAVFHDRFIDFRQEVRQMLASSQEHGLHGSMEQVARQALEDEAALEDKAAVDEGPRAYLRRFFEEQGFRRRVELSSIRFLDYNRELLPMFARPGMV
ncbi:cilia- and flagella-associated protein 61 isoform X2 [Pleurodeles waltl]|uniref:cilia- and flagella-associated protein 61 isoform X2 n=1 Tax=Pleurodeles waltl TaxID=8319 RepID=UPI0037099423